jgi:hypothetical protein
VECDLNVLSHSKFCPESMFSLSMWIKSMQLILSPSG